MNELRKAAQDVIDCVDSPYIPDEIRMVDVKCIEALRQALQAEPEPVGVVAQVTYLGGSNKVISVGHKVHSGITENTAKAEPILYAPLPVGTKLYTTPPPYAVQAEPEPMGTRTVDEPEPVCYITQAALDAIKRGANSSVRVWRNPDEPNGDVALYTTPPSVDALIADLLQLQLPYPEYLEVKAVCDKYRSRP